MTLLMRLDGVSRHYKVRSSPNPFQRPAVVRAVDGVSLGLTAGETFGLVGESGSGKSTLGRLALRLEDPTAGRVYFDGRDVTGLRGEQLRRLRAQMQAVFQDPLGSLNARMRVGQIVAEPLRVFHRMRGDELRDRVAELLSAVGLDGAKATAFPRSLSGGQRQRVGIARAIAVNPRLVLADEPVSALDVSVQAQVVNLLADLRERLGLTYLFIGHGLPVVRQISHRVGVMYLGRLVEVAETRAFFERPRHPYSRALLAAAPVPDPARRGNRQLLTGEPPSPTDVPSGCRFRSRCPVAKDVCARVPPPTVEVARGHLVECHFPLAA
ncbi:ABC transporter ATP-binding protein [Amycolatopsis alkalitolerans]|uniref:ABC transporter ATP-binding protein n=1 Tax=Amycolatopsis alkalitolerans TaxID=2547244 RepID=A0A5C4LWJ9_9PSEU|nr:ABC transporter ATP-binding protein [Amycolatopsis alkalitolerans]TNC22362.1 ABC transporter ATP-binding protein [Amycolatopsis alkalitolerans]